MISHSLCEKGLDRRLHHHLRGYSLCEAFAGKNKNKTMIGDLIQI